jgi:hypothetical protein
MNYGIANFQLQHFLCGIIRSHSEIKMGMKNLHSMGKVRLDALVSCTLSSPRWLPYFSFGSPGQKILEEHPTSRNTWPAALLTFSHGWDYVKMVQNFSYTIQIHGKHRHDVGGLWGIQLRAWRWFDDGKLSCAAKPCFRIRIVHSISE